MTGICNNFSSLKVNPYLSLIHLDTEKIIFSLYGKIKRIRGDYGFVFEPENLKSGNGMDSQVLRTLISSEVLVDKSAEEASSHCKAVIYGEGILASLCSEVFREYSCSVELRAFTSFFGEKQPLDQDVQKGAVHYVFCPSQASMADLLAVNQYCVSQSLDFSYFYFDGNSIAVGPSVIGKVPCFESLFTWKNKSLLANEAIAVSREEISRIQAAFDYGSEVLEPVFLAANILASQVLNVQGGGKQKNRLIKTQYKIPVAAELACRETVFESISTCQLCRERLASTFHADVGTMQREANHGFILRDIPTVHSENGYRLLDALNAKEMLDNALSRVGQCRIVELVNGKLDEVVPTYVSTLVTNGKTYNGFGKGVTHTQAYLSAGYETIERLCSEPRANLPMVTASWREVQGISLNVPQKIGQISFHRYVDVFDEGGSIDWVWGNSILSNKPLLIPAAMVFIGTSRFSGRFYVPSTGGIAAGTSFEDALLQGLFELVEHDAWMIWQANSVTCPKVDPHSIQHDEINRLITGFEACGYKVIIRYLATELDIPVFKVWLVQPESREVFAAQGMGCHLNKEMALLRALTEAKIGMPQRLYKKSDNTRLMSRGNKDVLDSRHSLFYLYHFLKTDMVDDVPSLRFDEIENLSTSSILGDINKVVSVLKLHIPDIEIAVVNLTDRVINIPVVRVIATGLQQLSQPIQSVQKRLFTVPKQLGKIDSIKNYNELFNGRFQF